MDGSDWPYQGRGTTWVFEPEKWGYYYAPGNLGQEEKMENEETPKGMRYGVARDEKQEFLDRAAIAVCAELSGFLNYQDAVKDAYDQAEDLWAERERRRQVKP